MKIKSGVVAGVISVLVLFAAFAYAEGQQGGMPDQQQTNQQGAMTQDPQTVAQIQQALKEQGYDPGPADGTWSSRTESALRQFQQAQGMEATGQPDQQTLASLGVEGAAAGGQQGEMPDQQGTMPDQQSGGQQGGSGY
jgi:peptidoglycan hydrolase-like protein with peptidoglycan-binding domain